MVVLGTDGFGRSDSRQALRRHFEVDAEHVAYAAVRALSECGQVPKKRVVQARKELGIDPQKVNPMFA
jgi:pyruvate dehydrogenase E1 component